MVEPYDDDDDDDEPVPAPTREGRKPMAEERRGRGGDTRREPKVPAEQYEDLGEGFIKKFFSEQVENFAHDRLLEWALGKGHVATLITAITDRIGSGVLENIVLPAIEAAATSEVTKKRIQKVLLNLGIPRMVAPIFQQLIEGSIEGLRDASRRKAEGGFEVSMNKLDAVRHNAVRNATAKLAAGFAWAELFFSLTPEDQLSFENWAKHMKAKKPEEWKLWEDHYRACITTLPRLEYVIQTANRSNKDGSSYDGVIPALQMLFPDAILAKKEGLMSAIKSKINAVTSAVKEIKTGVQENLAEATAKLESYNQKQLQSQLDHRNEMRRLYGGSAEIKKVEDLAQLNNERRAMGLREFINIRDYLSQ